MSEKTNLTKKWRQNASRRRMKKDEQMYKKYAGVRISKPPKALRMPIIFAVLMIMGVVYYAMMMLVFLRVVTGFWEFVMIIAAVTFCAFIIIMRETSIASAARTIKWKIGDAPAMVADGLVPGGDVKSLRFIGTDEKGKSFDETRHFEIGWCGALRKWPMGGKGPAIIALCNYGIVEDGKALAEGKTPQAGFMMGDEYIVPCKPEAYRFDMLEASRDSRYAKMLRSCESMSKKLHPRTWVVLAVQQISLPTGQVLKGPVVPDMELWLEKRLRKRTTSTLHDYGMGEMVTDVTRPR